MVHGMKSHRQWKNHTIPALYAQNFIALYTLYQDNYLTSVAKVKHETMC